MKIKIRYIIISILCVIICATNISAHSGNLSYYFDTAKIPEYENNVFYVGNEDIGWSLDESAHTNGKVATYKFETGIYELSNEYKAYVKQAAEKWSSVITFTESTNGVGNIGRISNPFAGPAEFNSYYTTSSGHFTSWNMQINTVYEEDYTSEQYEVFIAHELGHAIGLNDLYKSKNYDKLMCGEADYITAVKPAYQDIWGAMLITGQHTTHRWTKSSDRHYCTVCGGIGTHSIKNYSYTSNGASGHKVTVCSICNYSYTESHSKYYNQTTGKCSACGYTGLIQLGVSDQTE